MTAPGDGLPGTAPLSPAAAEASAAEPAPLPAVATERAAPAALAPLPPPAAGDEQWATTFGAIDVAAGPAAIAVRGDEVFLGGDFTTEMAGMPQDMYVRVAHWDGSGWRRMGDGVDAAVRMIAVVGEDVYVGGQFAVAGGTVAANGLARWDGSGWSEVAGGVGSSRSWVAADVRALASDGAKLYVAGVFDTVGAGAVAAAGFAVLDLATGTWEAAPDGGLWSAEEPGEGRALAVAGDRLYVGGSFERGRRGVGLHRGARPRHGGLGRLRRRHAQRGLRRHGRQPGGRPGHGHGLHRRPVPERGAVPTSGVATLLDGQFGASARSCTTTSRTR